MSDNNEKIINSNSYIFSNIKPCSRSRFMQFGLEGSDQLFEGSGSLSQNPFFDNPS